MGEERHATLRKLSIWRLQIVLPYRGEDKIDDAPGGAFHDACPDGYYSWELTMITTSFFGRSHATLYRSCYMLLLKEPSTLQNVVCTARSASALRTAGSSRWPSKSR